MMTRNVRTSPRVIPTEIAVPTNPFRDSGTVRQEPWQIFGFTRYWQAET